MIFIINIIISFSFPAYRNILIDIRNNISTVSDIPPQENEASIKKMEDTHLIESLERIDKHIESLAIVK